MSIQLDVALQSPESISTIPDIALSAERAGFGGIWSSEINHDPFIQLALAATATKKLSLGTSIALSFTRSPMVLAQLCWDLALLSRGRFILGLGTQVKAHNERRFSVKWEAPIPRLKEVIESLRAIWNCWHTGDRLNYRGTYYQFTLMTPFFTPPRHEYSVPITIAGVNAGLCRLAGEICDGFHVHPLHSAKYLSEFVRPTIEAGATAVGRELSEISLIASTFVVTGSSKQEQSFMREFVRQQISFYASTPSYRIIFEMHGWLSVAERLSELAARKKWGDMPKLISDEMINTFAIVGAPNEVAELALTRYSGLVDRLAFYLPYSPGQLVDFWASTIDAFQGQQS